MNLGNLFKNFHLEKVSLNLKAVQLEMSFEPADKDAAWDLYVEMLTRILTQPLPLESGDEKAALESVYSLAAATREILRSSWASIYTVQQGRGPRLESDNPVVHGKVAQGVPSGCFRLRKQTKGVPR